MRGEGLRSGTLFSYVDAEARIPAGHPLRAMCRLTNAALKKLDGSLSALYDKVGRPSISPADKNYDAEAFVEGLKAKGIAPHVAVNGAAGKRGKAPRRRLRRRQSRAPATRVDGST